MWILITFIVVCVVACIFAYKTAEVHELHKVRAAFELRKHAIEDQILQNHNVIVRAEAKPEEVANDYEQGEMEGLDEAIDIIEEMEDLVW